MQTQLRKSLMGAGMAMVLSGAVHATGGTAGPDVPPVWFDIQPGDAASECAQIDGAPYQCSFKINSPDQDGTYEHTCVVDGVEKTTTFTIKHNGSYLQWESSDSSIDAVIVKGGEDANVFYYQPEKPVSEDEGLHAPMDCGQNGNGLCGISHVTFCYDWNQDDDDDDDGNQWCSPGYWKNHRDAWAAAGISPDATFSSVITDFTLTLKSNAKACRSMDATNATLWEVISHPQCFGGDATNRVADLLSTAHPDVDFNGEDRTEDSCPLGGARSR